MKTSNDNNKNDLIKLKSSLRKEIGNLSNVVSDFSIVKTIQEVLDEYKIKYKL